MEHIDATKLADFQRCPQLYDYKHNQGYRKAGDQIDLIFGHLLGGALEIFEKALLDGQAHEVAHAKALQFVLDGAIAEDGSHRFGCYHSTWRCRAEVPYRNDKGNSAKCPFSHKGRYFPSPAPNTCSCGSQVELVQLWVPTKASKDIHTLIELLVGYTDSARARALIPIQIDGKPAVELYWELFFKGPNMLRPVFLCGNLDAIKAFGSEEFIVDYKTTNQALDARYWASFTPNVQVDLYNMAAKAALPSCNIRGVAIEAFSTSGETSTGFKLFQPSDSQKVEMANDTDYWITQLQHCEDTKCWPRNRASCFLCPFQPVCSREPEVRESILLEKYMRAKWNPTTRSLEPIGTPLPSTPKPTTTSPSTTGYNTTSNNPHPT